MGSSGSNVGYIELDEKAVNPRDEKRSNDIRIIEENTAGIDYAIGDIHGSDEAFKEVLKLLKPEDRLIIVGDIADRGAGSLAIYKLLLANVGKKPEIIVTRGNHEQLLLDAFSAIKDEKTYAKLRKLQGLQDNLKEYDAARLNEDHEEAVGILSNIMSQIEMVLDLDRDVVNRIMLYIQNGGGWIFSNETTFADLEKIANYIKTQTSYIVTVDPQANRPYHVVHADMPALLTDQEIYVRACKGLGLSEAERLHAMWARKDDKRHPIESVRSSCTVPVICGHDPLEGARLDTNHINHDIGTYNSNVLCLTNLKDGSCQSISVPQQLIDGKALVCIGSVNAALQHNNTIYDLINKNVNNKAAEIDKAIMAYINKVHAQKSPKEQKELYLGILSRFTLKWDETRRAEFANYLLQNSNGHLLAKERHWHRCSQSNIETRSFHQALGMLGVKPVNETNTNFSINMEQKAYAFTRHYSVFKDSQKQTDRFEQASQEKRKKPMK